MVIEPLGDNTRIESPTWSILAGAPALLSVTSAPSWFTAQAPVAPSLVAAAIVIVLLLVCIGLWFLAKSVLYRQEQRTRIERCRALVESSADAVVVASPEGACRMASAQAMRLLCSPTMPDLVGTCIADWTMPESRTRQSDDFRQVVATSGVLRAEYNLLAQDGSPLPAEIVWSALPDSLGRTNACVGVIYDIRPRKQEQERLRDRMVSLETLAEIERAVTSPFSLSERLDVLLQQTQSHMRADIAVVFFIDPTTQKLKMLAQRGHRNAQAWAEFGLEVGEGFAGWIVAHDRPLKMDDVREDARWKSDSSVLDEEIVSYLGVPLHIEGRVVGVLDVTTRRLRRFSSDEVQFLSTLGGTAAAAIQNALLVDQAQSRATQFAALYEITRDLSAHQDVPGLLKTVADSAARLLAAPIGQIFLYDAARGDLELTVAGDGFPIGIGERVRPGEGIVGRVAQTRLPLIVGDYQAWEHRLPRFDGLPIHHIMVVPMLYGGELIGTLGVNEARPTTRRFGEGDVRILSLLAAQAASAVHNARLYQETHTRAEQLALLYDAGLTLNRVLEPDMQIKFLLSLTMKTLHAERVTFSRYLPGEDSLRIDFSAGYSVRYAQALHGRIVTIQDSYAMSSRAARERMPVNVPDLAAETYWRATDPSVASGVWAPVLHGDHLLGVLGVLSTRTRAFTPQDERLLVLFANQVSVAMENARLFGETRRRADHLGVLSRISGGINRASGLDDMLEVTYREISMLFAADTFFVALFDAATLELDYRICVDEGVRYSLGRAKLVPGFTEQVIQTRKLLHVHDYEKEKERYSSPRMFGSMRHCATWLGVPMLKDDKVVGVISVQAYRPNAFSEEEEQLLVTIADQATGVFERARLLEETQRRAQEQSAVSRAARALNATVDVRAVFPAIVKEIQDLTDCERVSIALTNPSVDKALMVALDSPRLELAQDTFFSLDQSAAAEDVLAGRVHLTPDLSAEVGYPVERTLYDAGYRSRVNIPLAAVEQTIGSLNLDSRHLDAFRRDRLEPLQQIANAIAFAIQNNRLFEAESNRRNELAALYELSRELADASDLQTILALVAQRAVETLHITFACVLLVQEDTLIMRAGYPIRLLGRDISAAPAVPLSALDASRRVLADQAPCVLARNRAALSEVECRTLYFDIAQTVCLVPLTTAGRTYGLLLLGEARSEQREPFTEDKRRLAKSIGDQAASAMGRALLFAELEESYLQSVLSLANAVDAKDAATADHGAHMAQMATALGCEMGMSEREIDDLRYGALLHDIGKIGIPDAILQKPSPLTADEWTTMYRHPEIGAQIIQPIPRLAAAAQIVRHHHERYDGTGYPDRLAGDAIPLAARILAVVDAYSAMVDRRVYRPTMTTDQALAEIEHCSGTQFEPRVVQAFVKTLRQNDRSAPE